MPKYNDFELDIQNIKVGEEQQINIAIISEDEDPRYISYCYCPSYDRRPTRLICEL